MDMKKPFKRTLLILLLLVFLFQTTSVGATIGNKGIFLYSSDYFSNDRIFVDKLAMYFRLSEHSTLTENRPKVVYGMRQHMKNSESIYISCHGRYEGGVMILDTGSSSDSAVFGAADVPIGTDCKLVYLSVCYGSKNNTSTGKNLCGTLISNGYKAAVGYDKSVSVKNSRIYEEAFYIYLSRGESIYGAKIATEKELGDSCKEIIDAVDYFGNLGLIP